MTYFYETFDFEPRIVCPFCNYKMSVFRSNHIKEHQEHIAVHECHQPLCYLKPYNRYYLKINETTNELLSVGIALVLNEKLYYLYISKDFKITLLKELIAPKSLDSEYYLPVDLVSLDQYLEFNIQDPISSAKTIMDKLLQLSAFI